MLASHSSCVWEHGYSSLYSTRVIPWVFDDDEVLYLIHNKGFIVHQFVLKPVIQRECCSVHQQLIYYVDFILFVCSFSLMMYQMLLWWLYIPYVVALLAYCIFQPSVEHSNHDIHMSLSIVIWCVVEYWSLHRLVYGWRSLYTSRWWFGWENSTSQYWVICDESDSFDVSTSSPHRAQQSDSQSYYCRSLAGIFYSNGTAPSLVRQAYQFIAPYLWQAYHILAPYYHYKRQAYIYLLFPQVWNSAGFVPQVEQPHNQSFNSAALL